MSKWKKLYGRDYPEAHGKITKPEDMTKHLYVSDVPSFNHDMLVGICKNLGIDIQCLYDKYEKTKREQYADHGYKYEP